MKEFILYKIIGERNLFVIYNFLMEISGSWVENFLWWLLSVYKSSFLLNESFNMIDREIG